MIGLEIVDASLYSNRLLPRIHGSRVVHLLRLRVSNESLLRDHLPDAGAYLRLIDCGVLAARRGLYRERLDGQ